MGKWKQVSITRMGKTKFNPAGGIFEYRSDGIFISKGNKINYSIERDKIIIVSGKRKKSLLILSLSSSELILTNPERPSGGAIKFKRIK